MKFTASRLSSGNKMFPTEIYLESTGLTIKIPGLFKGESKQFDFDHIASVEIDTPMIGFSTISIFAGGTQMTATGFTKDEVKQIKKAIEDRKLNSKNNTHGASLSVADELKKLKDLVDAGVITPADFEQQKKNLLGH